MCVKEEKYFREIALKTQLCHCKWFLLKPVMKYDIINKNVSDKFFIRRETE